MDEKKTNILIIDDEEDVIYCLKNFLDSKGYAADSATSGEEALRKLTERNVDLILLDIIMPGLKGTEIAKIVREKYPNIRIVVATAFPKESEVLSREGLMEALITKPFRVQELYKKLQEVISEPEKPVKDKIIKTTELETKILFIKAKLLFVEPSIEIYESLHRDFKELAQYGLYYELDLATDENELSKKIKFTEPDIVIFEESYLSNLKPNVPADILLNSKKISEVTSFDLASAVENRDVMDKFCYYIRSLCLKNGLIEIR